MAKIYWNNLEDELIQAIKNPVVQNVVKKINDKEPDENGLITLTASDLGAITQAELTTALENVLKITDIVDDLNTGGTAKVLSAEQGKILKNMIATAGMTPEQKTKLDGIEEGANKYTLPTATTAILGGVKPDGTTIKVTADGVISTEVVDLSAYIKTVNTTITPDIQGNIVLTIGDLDGYTKTETEAKIKVTDDKVVSHIADTTIHTTQAEKDKLAGIEDEANKYVLPVATNTVLGGVKHGAGVEITADGTLNVVPQEKPQFGAFTTTTTADATHNFIYTPNVVIKPEDTTKNFIINYNTTTLGEADFSIQEVGGVRVIVLNVEEADTVERNSVSGFILRGFSPLS